MKKNVLDLNDFTASFLDDLHEFLGKGVSLHLVSALHLQPGEGNGLKGKVGKPAYLENWITTGTLVTAGESTFQVTYEWDEEIGIPGAFLIKNNHQEFYLRTLTLEDVPGQGDIHFVCNTWVYPAHKYRNDSVFFSNKAYLPSETPEALLKYREEELENLRGDGRGELQKWDRVYDYAYYNDLGDPDKGPDYARPILGGTSEYPYPRRGRTGRPPSKLDPNTESRLSLAMSLNIYVPRDERFGHLKLADFLAYALKSVVQVLKPELESLFDSTPNEFDSFEDVIKLYEAGINPITIQRLQEFPPTSKLDPKVYGEQSSTITKEQLEINLDGLTVDEAIRRKKLFILDYHDALYPYLRRINSTSTKTYASRTILFLQDIGTLKPLAIELSKPHPNGDQFGVISKVYMPAEEGSIKHSIWKLAKAYVGVNDSGYHQLISHWLRTHATIELAICYSYK
ncbi:hypothetical protein K1719_030201 [Acacia pycnantha]|nr:hypothetical protein K1719_030201 [Acacia pycnantha]